MVPMYTGTLAGTVASIRSRTKMLANRIGHSGRGRIPDEEALWRQVLLLALPAAGEQVMSLMVGIVNTMNALAPSDAMSTVWATAPTSSSTIMIDTAASRDCHTYRSG